MLPERATRSMPNNWKNWILPTQTSEVSSEEKNARGELWNDSNTSNV